MKAIHAPETALMLGKGLTEVEAKILEREVATVGREYGRAAQRVRALRAELKRAEDRVREVRRQMRMLISARRIAP